MVDLNKGLKLWGQWCKCRSIRATFTTQHVSVMGGIARCCRAASDGRMAGGVGIGDIGIRGKVEGVEGVPSLGCSQTQGGSHGGSRLPLVGGVHVSCDA